MFFIKKSDQIMWQCLHVSLSSLTRIFLLIIRINLKTKIKMIDLRTQSESYTCTHAHAHIQQKQIHSRLGKIYTDKPTNKQEKIQRIPDTCTRYLCFNIYLNSYCFPLDRDFLLDFSFKTKKKYCRLQLENKNANIISGTR